jgi:outer membrane receptor protein involved in Fe transport
MNAALSVGDFIFNGRATGLGLADFLTGQVSQFRHGAPGLLINDQWYLGLYGQDTWRATDRVTLNLGLRWEPYFGTNFKDATISNFVRENFDRGIKSTVYVNAPAGLIYPGDPGFPEGTSGLKKQWLNLSPRVGAAWDVNGDGRLAVRASYAINYDYPGAVFQNTAVQAAPFNNRIDLIGNLPFDDPYRVIPGGQTHPVTGAPPRDVTFPGLGSYAVIDPDINSMRVQSWNVTVEQQLGTAWQVSASYLGNYMDRLWGPVQINPGVFLGLGPCTLNGVFYPTCSTTANVEARRVFTLQNPVEGRLMSNVSRYDDVGEQTYKGLKLSFRRRAADGISLAGNYTVSKCMTDTQWTGSFIQFSSGYTNPDNPAYDRGNCSQNQRQIANLTVGYQTPELGNAVLRVLASDWRVSGIVNARTGSWLTVTTGRDPVFSGIPGQRVDQVNDDPYSSEKTLASYLNPAAFAYPAPGMLGNEPNRGIEGPGFWTVDMSLARLLPFGNTRTLELRVEAFNLLNNFNWGNPGTNLDAGTFGRITSQAGSSRIMQFAVKYGF